MSFDPHIQIIIDFVVGGSVQYRLNDTFPDATTAKRILAETVAIVEKLHNVNIIHGDLSFSNILIDKNGHFVLTDFAFSTQSSDKDASKCDWNRLYYMCYRLFAQPKRNKNEFSVMKLLGRMTDAHIQGDFDFITI